MKMKVYVWQMVSLIPAGCVSVGGETPVEVLSSYILQRFSRPYISKLDSTSQYKVSCDIVFSVQGLQICKWPNECFGGQDPSKAAVQASFFNIVFDQEPKALSFTSSSKAQRSPLLQDWNHYHSLRLPKSTVFQPEALGKTLNTGKQTWPCTC